MKNPEKLLDLLSQDARLSTAQLAAMTRRGRGRGRVSAQAL